MIEIKNLSKTYKGKNRVHAINNLSIQLPDKGLVFIVGKSGCGKSTLLNLIGGLDSFDEGEISIDHFSLSKLNHKDLDDYRNYMIGFVFQEYNLFEEYTVSKNLEFALDLQNETNKEEKIKHALQNVELSDLGNRVVSELSGGQKQRVAIARAIIKNPKIILCDEPTGALDSENSQLVFQLLKKLSEENLVIVVSHDNESAFQYGDRVIKLSDGKVIQDEMLTPETSNSNLPKTIEKKHHFSSRNKFLLSCSYLKKRPIRLGISIILSVLCFILIGSSSSIASMQSYDLIAHSMQENDNRYVAYEKSSYLESGDIGDMHNMNDEDIQYISNELEINEFDIIYDYFLYEDIPNLAAEGRELQEKDYYYYSEIYGFAEIDNDFIKRYGYTLIGNLPQNDNEIVITKYFFNLYKEFGFLKDDKKIDIFNYEDILNQIVKMDYSSEFEKYFTFKIVGILDTNFNEERYAPLLEENVNIEQYKELVDEIREMMENGGLHNILYLNSGFYDRNIKEVLKNKYIASEEISILNVDETEYKYFDFNKFTKLSSINDKELTTYFYKNDSDKILDKNEILLPLSITDIRYGETYDRIKEKADKDLQAFVQQHYNEIKDQFEKDYADQFPSQDSYNYFIRRLTSNQINPYHSGITYAYFEAPYIIEELEKTHFDNFKELTLQIDHEDFLKYNVELAGFYDDVIHSSLSQKIYVSDELKEQIFNDVGYKRYDYKYVVVPISKNYKQNLKMAQFRDKKRDEQIRILDGFNEKELSSYSLYRFNNEITWTINNIEGILEMMALIFKYVFIVLIVFVILFINYYFSGLIYDEKKNIGILKALGATKKDIVDIFVFEGISILLIIACISSILSALVIHFGNNYLMSEFYFPLSILNFSIKEILLILGICLLSITLGIIIPLVKLVKKKPVNLIRTKYN